ncbi:MAG: hypothetical protein ACTSV7_00115 [Candidatus Baldrarchaeia archaeon]
MENLLYFIQKLQEPPIKKLDVLPEEVVVIPCMQKFKMAPYKFKTVKLSNAFLFEDEESIFYIADGEYGAIFITRTTANLYEYVFKDPYGIFPQSLRYYVADEHVFTPLLQYIKDKFGVFFTSASAHEKSTFLPVLKAGKELEKDYFIQGRLELLRIHVHETGKLSSFYLQPAKDKDKIYNHKFESTTIHRFKNSRGHWFLEVPVTAKITSEDHETIEIPSGNYIAHHPPPEVAD